MISRSGLKRIDEVRLGDEILGFNYATDKVEFTRVRAWLHRTTESLETMTRLDTDVGHIVASARHSLASGNKMFFTDKFRAGDALVTPNGSILVRKISQENGHGNYAPLTWTSNFFVAAEGSKSSFLADCFAHVPSPERFHHVFHLLLSAVEFVWPAVHSIDDSGKTDYLHPVCQRLMPFGLPFGIKTETKTYIGSKLPPSEPLFLPTVGIHLNAPPNDEEIEQLEPRRLGLSSSRRRARSSSSSSSSSTSSTATTDDDEPPPAMISAILGSLMGHIPIIDAV